MQFQLLKFKKIRLRFNRSQRNQLLEEGYIEQGLAVTRSAILKLEFFESGCKFILQLSCIFFN